MSFFKDIEGLLEDWQVLVQNLRGVLYGIVRLLALQVAKGKVVADRKLDIKDVLRSFLLISNVVIIKESF